MKNNISKKQAKIKRFINMSGKFTNQRELTKKEFLNYFEKKVFKTIKNTN